MAPPKPAEMKSTNRYTVKELARRAQKTGFEAVLEKSKRALKQAEWEARKKVRQSHGFGALSKDEQEAQLSESVKAVNAKR
jgi:hypothetical protein